MERKLGSSTQNNLLQPRVNHLDKLRRKQRRHLSDGSKFNQRGITHAWHRHCLGLARVEKPAEQFRRVRHTLRDLGSKNLVSQLLRLSIRHHCRCSRFVLLTEQRETPDIVA